MPRNQNELARDEVRIITGETCRLTAGTEWIEVTTPIETLPQDPVPTEVVKNRYEINDVVTDAINVTVLDAEPLPNGDLPIADYDFNTFKENVANGILLPESMINK